MKALATTYKMIKKNKRCCHLVVDCPHLRQLDVVGGHGLLEQARVQLPPHVREPDVVGGSGAETINR